MILYFIRIKKKVGEEKRSGEGIIHSNLAFARGNVGSWCFMGQYIFIFFVYCDELTNYLFLFFEGIVFINQIDFFFRLIIFFSC